MKPTNSELNNIRNIISNIYKNESINFIDRIGGMTNTNYYCETNVKKCVVRIPGQNTEIMINRYFEKYNCQLATKININPRLYHYDIKPGIKITEFVEDSETLTPHTIKKKDNLLKIASILKKLHTSDLKFLNVFNVFEQYRNYTSILSKDEIQYADFDKTETFFYSLEKKINFSKIQLTACHNDPVPENFLLQQEKIFLIDWEYSGMNDPLWDISALFEESRLPHENEDFFLNTYFANNQITKDIREKILIYRICQNLLWSIWALIKKEQNRFEEYGNDRYKKCLEQIEIYKSLYYDK